jgi:flagellar hook protein FlgE
MIGFNTSLEGLARSETQFNQAAQQIAQSSTPQGEDTVSLSDAAVQLIESKNNFDANTKALKTEDQMNQYLLNAIG